MFWKKIHLKKKLFFYNVAAAFPAKMNKCLAFVLIAMIAVNGILAAPRSDDEEKEVESSTKEATCSPWLGYVSANKSENNLVLAFAGDSSTLKPCRNPGVWFTHNCNITIRKGARWLFGSVSSETKKNDYDLQCQLYEHCCRDLMCAGYLLKCVPIGGIRPPGKDTRPIGPPPYYPRPRGFEGDDDTSEDKSEWCLSRETARAWFYFYTYN